MSAANVLEFPANASGYFDPAPNHAPDRVTFQVSPREGERVSQQRLGSRELYPALEHEDSYAGAALRVLDKVLGHIERAVAINDSYLESDTELMKARIQLSRAFDYREALGQGYAALVNATIWGLANASVELPSSRQLRILGQVLGRLRNGPYMHFDTAMILMDELESEGFDIEPAALDELLVDDNA
jgi:hypothetical protein